MNITILGMKDEKEAEHLHTLGFACEHCPLVEKMLDAKACTRDASSYI